MYLFDYQIVIMFLNVVLMFLTTALNNLKERIFAKTLIFYNEMELSMSR